MSDERSSTPAVADLILINGCLWTGSKSQPLAEALASRGERIVAVGSNSDIKSLADGNTRVIDLQGKLALPGFVDGHTHFIEGGFHLLSVDLRDAATPEEFALRIKDHAAKLPAGRWITGDWDHERWASGVLPAKALIDRYTKNNPVFVMRLDGHMGLANSAALRLAGITKQTKDPPGGSVVRDAGTGEPTGILKDDAQRLVHRVIPEATERERDEALKASLAEAARVGVTSIQDITSWQDYEAYSRFRDSGRLTVRVYARTPMRLSPARERATTPVYSTQSSVAGLCMRSNIDFSLCPVIRWSRNYQTQTSRLLKKWMTHKHSPAIPPTQLVDRSYSAYMAATSSGSRIPPTQVVDSSYPTCPRAPERRTLVVFRLGMNDPPTALVGFGSQTLLAV